MGFSPLIYVFKNLYREETRAALTDVKISANEIAPYSMEKIEGSRSCHTARHEAANGDSERSLDGPYHPPARPVRLCNHGFIRDVDPFIVYAYAVMATLGFPIRVQNSETIRIRTARPLAGPEAVKPRLERRQRIAAVVSGLHRTDECRRENTEGGAEDRDLLAHVRRLIKTPIQITQVVRVSLIVSTLDALSPACSAGSAAYPSHPRSPSPKPFPRRPTIQPSDLREPRAIPPQRQPPRRWRLRLA